MTDRQGPGGDWAAPDASSAPSPSPWDAGSPAHGSVGWGPPPAPTDYAAPAQPSVPEPPTESLTFRSWQPGIVALRPLPFGDFLTVPFRAMRFSRAAVVGAPVLMFLASALITVAAFWLAATDSGVTDFFTATSNVAFEPRPETIGAFALAGIVWILSDTLSAAVVVPAVAQAALGRRMSLGEAMRTAIERIWALLGLGLLTILASVLLFGVVFAPIFVSAASDSGMGGAVALTLILALVLIAPGMIVMSVYLPVARAALMLEKIGPFAAIRRAIRLVPGRFWWTVLILLVLGLINGAIQQVFSFGTQMVALVVSAISPESDIAFFGAFGAALIIQLLASAIVQYSFVGSATALIYLDMRFRKEGLAFDMARAAEARATATPPVG